MAVRSGASSALRVLIAGVGLLFMASLPASGQAPGPGAAGAGIARHRAEVENVLRIKALTLAMRAAMRQSDEARATQEMRAVGARLLAAPTAGTSAGALEREHREAAAAFFEHVAQSIARAQRWPSDQPAETYRRLARATLDGGRFLHARLLNGGRYPGLGVDEAYTALAWSEGRTPAPDDPAMPKRVAERLLDRALPEPAVAVPVGANMPKGGPMAPKEPASGIDRTLAAGMMNNVDLRGSDIGSTPVTNPQQCRDTCQRDGRCMAWTWVRPPQPGGAGICYIKNTVPRQSGNNCCISAIERTAGTAGSLIGVVAATYGANCGVGAGNATRAVAGSCNGKATCNYTIDVAVLGDPKFGCAKNFTAQWQCSGKPGTRSASAPAEAGRGSVISLSCN